MRLKRRPQVPPNAWANTTPGERSRIARDIALAFKGDEFTPPLRKVFKGFEPKDGFDVSRIASWTKPQLAMIRRYIGELRTLTARKHIVVTPRDAAERKAIRYRTGLTFRRLKGWIVPVTDPQRDRIRFIDGRAVDVRDVGGGTLAYRQLFLFKDYNKGRQPETFAETLKVARRMLKFLPEKIRGKEMSYMLHSKEYGNIQNSFTKPFILRELQRYHEKYDISQYQKQHAGFGETVIGLYMTGTSVQADALLDRIQKRKDLYRIHKRKRLKKSRGKK